MRKWLRGRASPCQGEGREFESRLPLQQEAADPQYAAIFIGVWRSLVACLNGVQEAGSSNLLTQTDDGQTKDCPFSFTSVFMFSPVSAFAANCPAL